LQAQNKTGGDDFLPQLLAGDETWIYYFELETTIIRGVASHELPMKEHQNSSLRRRGNGRCLLGHERGDSGRHYEERNSHQF
jgi:hypothetical protein